MFTLKTSLPPETPEVCRVSGIAASGRPCWWSRIAASSIFPAQASGSRRRLSVANERGLPLAADLKREAEGPPEGGLSFCNPALGGGEPFVLAPAYRGFPVLHCRTAFPILLRSRRHCFVRELSHNGAVFNSNRGIATMRRFLMLIAILLAAALSLPWTS